MQCPHTLRYYVVGVYTYSCDVSAKPKFCAMFVADTDDCTEAVRVEAVVAAVPEPGPDPDSARGSAPGSTPGASTGGRAAQAQAGQPPRQTARERPSEFVGLCTCYYYY